MQGYFKLMGYILFWKKKSDLKEKFVDANIIGEDSVINDMLI